MRNVRSMAQVSILALLSLLTLGGCASFRATAARDQYLREQIDSHEIQADLDTAWGEALKLMTERGFGLGKADRDPANHQQDKGLLAGLVDKSMSTYKVKDGRQFAETDFEDTHTLRYRIEGKSTSDKTCRIMFWAIRQSDPQANEVPPKRDPEMELNLVRAIEPETAAKILEGADAIGP